MTGRRRLLCALIALLATPAVAAAQPLDLTLHDVPLRAMPTRLTMRAATDPPTTGTGSTGGGGSADPSAATERSLRERTQDALVRSFLDLPDELDELDERVVFHFDLGFGLDGGEPAGDSAALRGGDRPLRELDDDPNGFYERLRVYSFGDAILGSNGLLVPSLSTYFSSQFRFSQGSIPPASAVPTVYDSATSGDAVLVRHAYAELHDLFEHRLLAPLFIRAGRQFRYGAAIAHFDGATVGYDGKAFSFGAFSGQRVALYGLDEISVANEDLITGSNVRINLYHLKKVPLVLSGQFLNFDGAQHFLGGLGLRLSRDSVLRARIRTFDGSLAQEHAALRARLSKVTTLHVAFDNRHSGDWTYDLLVAEPSYPDGDDPRRFLAFGTPRSRLRLSARAGTVVRDNLDLLARAAIAREHDGRGDSALHPSYLEAGLAFQMRFRRSLQIGSSVLARRYSRAEPTSVPRLDGAPDPLPLDNGSFGDRSFVEGDVSFAYVLGARNFAARADLYTRAYRAANALEAPLDSNLELRSGARVSLEGWAGDRLRMKGEYETAFAPEYLSPEIRGPKSLRILLEAMF